MFTELKEKGNEREEAIDEYLAARDFLVDFLLDGLRDGSKKAHSFRELAKQYGGFDALIRMGQTYYRREIDHDGVKISVYTDMYDEVFGFLAGNLRKTRIWLVLEDVRNKERITLDYLPEENLRTGKVSTRELLKCVKGFGEVREVLATHFQEGRNAGILMPRVAAGGAGVE